MKVFVVVKIYQRLLQRGDSIPQTDVVDVFANEEAAGVLARKILSDPQPGDQGPPNVFVIPRDVIE
jgi:hypothetical protein